MALSWGIIFLAVDISFSGFHFRHAVDLLFPSTSGVCWYFSAYMLLLVISPIINVGMEMLDKHSRVLLLAFVLLVGFVGGTLYRVNGTTFMQLFLVYLIGRHVRKYPLRFIEKSPCICFMSSSFCNFSLAFICSYAQLGGGQLTRMVENNRNPLVLFSAISLFMVAKKYKDSVLTVRLSKLAPYMFSVYIGHVYLLYTGILKVENNLIYNKTVSLVVYAVLFLLSFVILDKLRTLLFGRILDEIGKTLTSVILKQR